VGHIQLAPNPVITGAPMRVSFDGGATWHASRVAATGPGLRHPGPLGVKAVDALPSRIPIGDPNNRAYQFSLALGPVFIPGVGEEGAAAAAGARVLDGLAAETKVAADETSGAGWLSGVLAPKATALAHSPEVAAAGDAAGAGLATESNLATVTEHLNNIGAGPLDHPPNAAMLSRIQGAIASGRDLTPGEANFHDA
jgi:hypothetical protein